MSIPTTPVPEAPFTIGTPEFSADPLGHYAWLRENAPLARTELVYGPCLLYTSPSPRDS